MAEEFAQRSRVPSILMGLACTFIVLALTRTELFRTLELITIDARFRLRPAPERSDRIVHIDIDDGSIKALGRFPWPRDRYAQLIDVLTEYGAKAIVFDIEFTEPSRSPIDQRVFASIVDQMQSALQNLQGQIAQLASSSATTQQNPKDVLASLADALGALGNQLHRAEQQQRRDLDALFGKAVKRSGRVYLPFRFPSAPDLPEAIQKRLDNIAGILEKNIVAGADEIASQTGLSRKAIEACIASLKKIAIRRFILRELKRNPSLTADDVCARLIPNYTEGERSFEAEAVAQVFDQVRATRLVIQRCGHRALPSAAKFLLKRRLEPPLSVLIRSARGGGFVVIAPDPEDGTVRRVPLVYRYKNDHDVLFYQLGFQVACDELNLTDKDIDYSEDGFIILHPKGRSAAKEIRIPVDEKGRALVNWPWTRRESWTDGFRHLPFAVVIELYTLREDIASNLEYIDDTYLNSHMRTVQQSIDTLQAKRSLDDSERQQLASLLDEKKNFPHQALKALDENIKQLQSMMPDVSASERPSLEKAIRQIRLDRQILRDQIARRRELEKHIRKNVKGRICIIGMTATASTDLKPTPIYAAAPAVSIHSAIINMILTNQFVREPGIFFQVAATIVAGVFVTLIASRANPLTTVFSVAGLAVAYLCTDLWFSTCFFPLASPIAAAMLDFAAITAYRQLTEERQRRQLKRIFQQYVSPAVVEEMVKNPDKVRLGGERKELTVFFSDIAGFTPISEHLDVLEVEALLTEYLTEMTDVVFRHEGTLDKYEGDAVMAIFGAPLPQTDHAARACLSAIEQFERLVELNKRFAERGWPPINIRIGINTGIMVVGNMGSVGHFDYTVLGDNVNLGARLEPANKEYGSRAMITEYTYAQARDAVEARSLGRLQVVGREGSVEVFELLARKGELSKEMAALLEVYEEGFRAYLKREWDRAIVAFDRALKIKPDDGPSAAFRRWSVEYKNVPLPDDWDGVHIMKSK